MNKKSFFFGVFVGVSITWALSFYLYYSLNNGESAKLSNLQKNIFNFDDDSDEADSRETKGSNVIHEKNEKQVDGQGKLSYFKQKLEKEKDKRKVSQKLIEELTPVTVKQLEKFGIIKNAEDQFVRDNGYKTHAFNALVSNNIGSIREIPDTRHKS